MKRTPVVKRGIGTPPGRYSMGMVRASHFFCCGVTSFVTREGGLEVALVTDPWWRKRERVAALLRTRARQVADCGSKNFGALHLSKDPGHQPSLYCVHD